MPARLRPTGPIAPEAILVGDPGRALMLAQELLRQPKMSNHARGLWGYTGVTHEGDPLTLQATGMGGPSATVVLRDLAELGVRRAVRIGTGASLGDLALGERLIVGEARIEPGRGSRRTHTVQEEPRGAGVEPDLELTEALAARLGDGARVGAVASLDVLPPDEEALNVEADVADLQTATLLAAATDLCVAPAAVLIVSEKPGSGQIRDEVLEAAAKAVGRAATAVLSA
jgi:purine-nucleoside phosphorylase